MWFFIVLFIALFIIGASVTYMMFEAHQNRVITHEVPIDCLMDKFNGYKIFFISDIHRRTISSQLLSQIKEKPDVIIIGGDLAEKGVPFERINANVGKLAVIAPIIFVWGNHDLLVDREKFEEILNDYRVKILDNQTHIVTIDDQELNIIGINDVTTELDRLDEAIATRGRGTSILISHNPAIKKQLEPSHHIPLVVSGHTHGGQIRLLGWGPREKGGIKKHPFGTLIISNGYGTTHLPLRFCAPPDALLLILRKGNEGS